MAHVAETRKVESKTNEEFGMSSVSVLKKYNLLNNRTLLIHGNNLLKEDMELIRKSGAYIIHCLSSNLSTADGTVDLTQMKIEQIPACIATDGFVTSGTFSVLSEARKSFLFHNKNSAATPIVSSQEIFDMITINPARVLGIQKKAGSIEVGKRADLVFFKCDSASIQDPINYLIEKTSLDVDSVIVGGKKILWRQKFQSLDDAKINENYLKVIAQVKDDLESKIA